MAFTKIAAAGIGSTETVTVDGLTVINNGSFGGNLSVGGTLTYEDVTNVDSVGLITARNGIVVGSGITLSKDGNIFATGISTFGGNIQLSGTNPEIELNNGGPRFRVPASNTLTIHTGGGLGSANEERLRFTSDGKVGINQSSPTEDLEVKGDQTATVYINAGQHDASTANEATLKFGFNQSHGDDSIGYVKLLEAGGNSFDGHMTFGVPYNNSGTPATTERLRITSAGKLQVPIGSDIEIGQIASSNHADGNAGSVLLGIQDGGGAMSGVKVTNVDAGTYNDQIVTFLTAQGGVSTPTERLRITSSGQLFMSGNTGYNESAALISFATDDAAGANMLSDSSAIYNHNNPAFIHIQNRYNTGDNQESGIILHSKSSQNSSWAIYNKRTAGFNGDLIFRGRTGQNASAERARITSAGLFGIGVTPSYQLHVKAGSVDQTARFDNAKTADDNINYIGVCLGNAGTTGTGLFGMTGHSTAGSQACWIGMAGDDVAGGYGLKVFRGGNAVNMQRFAIGTQDHSGFVSGTDASMIISYQKTYRFALYIRPSDNNTGGGSPALFANQAGTAIGSISANASNVAFNTSSDYRLKENDISIIDGITRLKKLRPIKFNWKTDTEKTVDGFLAHEVSSSVPEAVMGEKDAVNEDGSIKPQQLDYSKLVPLLTAALQEEIAKRESLEARLDAAGL